MMLGTRNVMCRSLPARIRVQQGCEWKVSALIDNTARGIGLQDWHEMCKVQGPVSPYLPKSELNCLGGLVPREELDNLVPGPDTLMICGSKCCQLVQTNTR